MNKPKTKRLFIGIPVDAACQQQLDIHLQYLQQNHNELHWIPSYNRHLTLAFIGDADAQTVIRLQLQFTVNYRNLGAFTFVLNEARRFPDDKGRILAAVNTASAPLNQLHEQTLNLLKQCEMAPGKLEFRPHISLAKIHHHHNVTATFVQPLDLPLLVDRVNLYESSEGVTGRVYTVLAECLLRG